MKYRIFFLDPDQGIIIFTLILSKTDIPRKIELDVERLNFIEKSALDSIQASEETISNSTLIKAIK